MSEGGEIKNLNLKKITINSKQIIGNVEKRFDQLKHKKWDWSSFYNGWLEGRFQMLIELDYIKTGKDKK